MFQNTLTNTTTASPPHHNNHTTTTTPQQSHHHQHSITTTPQQSHHHQHTTTATAPPPHHYYHTTITPPPFPNHHHHTTNTTPPPLLPTPPEVTGDTRPTVLWNGGCDGQFGIFHWKLIVKHIFFLYVILEIQLLSSSCCSLWLEQENPSGPQVSLQDKQVFVV